MPRRAVGTTRKAIQFDFDQMDRRKVRLPVFVGMSRFIRLQ